MTRPTPPSGPKLPMKNGDQVTFYTRALDDSQYPVYTKDRMQVYANFTDGTTNVGVASEVVRPEIGVIAKAEPVAFAEGMEAALRIDRTVARQFAASARPDMSFTRTSDCLFELLAKAAENRP